MAEEVLWALVLTLAVYRLALMIATEDGPFDFFYGIRDITLGTLGDKHWITRGIYCPLCVGFWISLLAGLFMGGNILSDLAFGLAIAGAQTFLTLIGGVPGSDDA